MITLRFTTIMYQWWIYLVISLMQCKEHNLLLADKTLCMLEWFKTIAKWWIDGEISDDDFTKNVNFLRNEGLLGPNN